MRASRSIAFCYALPMFIGCGKSHARVLLTSLNLGGLRSWNGSAPTTARSMFFTPEGCSLLMILDSLRTLRSSGSSIHSASCAHAPSMAWPQTRIVLPVTAFDAGLAK